MRRTVGALVVAVALAGGSLLASGTTAAVRPPFRVVVEPEATMSFLSSAIVHAHHAVLVEMYELRDPALEADLVARVRAHVTVEVLLDRKYDAGSVNAAAYATLRAGHVAVRWTNDAELFHEKAVVVDGATAYVGTGNLTSQYYATTRDFWVVDTQRADVDAVLAAFRHDWAGGLPAPAPKGVDLVWSPGAESTVLGLLARAHHSIDLESEELEADAVVNALVAAAHRHVAVHVTMTYDSSYRWAYDELVHAGASVHLDHGETPIYIHAKALCIDCAAGAPGKGTVLVGSQNLSTASLVYNRELSIETTSPSVVQPILRVLAADFAQAAPYS